MNRCQVKGSGANGKKFRLRAEAVGAAGTPPPPSMPARLDEADAMTLSELAVAEQVRPQTRGQMLDELEQRGWIGRRPHPTDRRRVHVSLTAPGRKAFAKGRALRQAWLAAEFSQINAGHMAVAGAGVAYLIMGSQIGGRFHHSTLALVSIWPLNQARRGAIKRLRNSSVWPIFRLMIANWFFWALLSALFAALTAVLAKMGVADINSNLATAIRTTVILAFTWAVAVVTGGAPQLTAITPRTWLFLAASGIATGLSWLCYFRALQLGDVAKVAPVDKLSVAMAVVLAVVFLGEKVRPQEACGAGLIIIGVVVMVVKF